CPGFGAKMDFTGGAAHHPDAHGEKTRKSPTNQLDNGSGAAAQAFDQILADKKQRLNGANGAVGSAHHQIIVLKIVFQSLLDDLVVDRKSTRLNSSHRTISYAVFCLKKKKQKNKIMN